MASHHEKLELPNEMLEFGEVEENTNESGISHLLSAILACSETPGGLTGEVPYGVLSFYCEGILNREEIPEWTLESGAVNGKCVATIEFQKCKISEYLNHSHYCCPSKSVGSRQLHDEKGPAPCRFEAFGLPSPGASSQGGHCAGGRPPWKSSAVPFSYTEAFPSSV